MPAHFDHLAHLAEQALAVSRSVFKFLSAEISLRAELFSGGSAADCLDQLDCLGCSDLAKNQLKFKKKSTWANSSCNLKKVLEKKA